MLNDPKAHDLLFWFDAKPKLLSNWGTNPLKFSWIGAHGTRAGAQVPCASLGYAKLA